MRYSYALAIGGNLDLDVATDNLLVKVKEYGDRGYAPQGGVCHAMTVIGAGIYHVFSQALTKSEPVDESGVGDAPGV